MQQTRLDAQVRDTSGKGAARSLRRTGKVPAVLYGRNQEVLSLQIDDYAFKSLLRSHGANALINLDVTGNGEETVIIKDLQHHPVKRNILHADFQRVSLDEEITTLVDIEIVGSAIGVRDGGILTLVRRQLNISCLPLDIPESITVNVDDLNIGQSVQVSDLEIDDDNIEILDDSILQIVSVIEPKVVLETVTTEEDEEDIEGEEGVEGEETTETDAEVAERPTEE
jgi:large subunit ribosomal protein L25